MSTEKTIELDGDNWKVLALGAQRDGRTYCHLASTTRFREQRNGRMPVQISGWLDDELLSDPGQQGRQEAARLRAL